MSSFEKDLLKIFLICEIDRYYTILEADHVLFVINRERAGVQFDILYDSIFHRCRRQMSTSRAISAVPSVDQGMDHICSNVENCMCQLYRFDQRQY